MKLKSNARRASDLLQHAYLSKTESFSDSSDDEIYILANDYFENNQDNNEEYYDQLPWTAATSAQHERISQEDKQKDILAFCSNRSGEGRMVFKVKVATKVYGRLGKCESYKFIKS